MVDVLESSSSDEVIFKKKLKKLEQFRGRGTELISVYIPGDADRSSVTGQLSEEISQSGNIKSPSTRKNVQGALRKIISFLKQIDFKIPKNGIVVFAGNISQVEGRTDIRLFTVRPIKDLRTKRYWCDSQFHLEPLKEMAKPSNVYALITIDKSEATIAALIGKRYEILGHFNSGVSGKIRAGGQCLAPDTLIMKDNGEIIPIEKAHNPFRILSENFNTEQTEQTPIMAKWENNKELFELTTCYPKLGIKSSKDHLFFVRTNAGIESKPLEEIKEGDYLLMPEKINLGLKELQDIDFKPQIRQEWNMKKAEIPIKLEGNLARLLGYYLGDGNYEIDRICFSEERQEIAHFYKQLIENMLKVGARIRYREKKSYYETRVGSRIVSQFFKQIYGSESKTLTAEIPKIVLKSPDHILAQFVAGFFDAEGYVSSSRAAFGINNISIARQFQFVLLRLGIISSLPEYDNRRNPYSKKTRFTLEINDTESLRNFERLANFACEDKKKKLRKIIAKRSNRNKVRKIVINGKEVARILRDSGVSTTQFRCPDFFINKKQLNKEVFKKNIIDKINDPDLKRRLELFYQSNLIPAKISKIEPIGKYRTIDIETKTHNFLANGLIVHNSAQRFERLREEAEQEFYKRISGKANAAFVPFGEKLQGMIIGGPGMTKQFFLDKDMLDHRIKDKVLALLDTSYTDESGIRELVQKSDAVLKDTDLMKERNLMNNFLTQLAKDQLATYGENEVMKALEIGQVATLLVSEAIEWAVYKVKNTATGEERIIIDKDNSFDPNSFKGQEQIEVVEEYEFIDYIMERAQQTSTGFEIISTETPEGEQFYKGFGGIGAMLRYKL